MSKHIEIQKIFEKNILKKTYTELCYEENSKNSMISSSKKNFSYDLVCSDLKTSDTIFLFADKIEFIEFKDVSFNKLAKTDRDFIRQLRLKAIESFITFHNFLNSNYYPISKDEISDLNLNYFFVFNKDKFRDKPTLLNAFSAAQLKWTNRYQGFYKKISFLDHETFIKKYKI
mgnify:CR=1 FL=1|jgi:hypothetical protein